MELTKKGVRMMINSINSFRVSNSSMASPKCSSMASKIEPLMASNIDSSHNCSSDLSLLQNSSLEPSSPSPDLQSPTDHLSSLSLTAAAIAADETAAIPAGDRGEERENSDETKPEVVEEDDVEKEVVVEDDDENNSPAKINDDEVEGEEEREKESSRRRKGGVSGGGGSRFPVRLEAEDCSFYVRTGSCKFGMNCKFNHPTNHQRRSQGAKVKAKEECLDACMPKVKEKDESVDKEQIDCKYVDRPGGCKFGKACKFNHSRKVNSTCKLNFMGLPIRPGEKECPFYMRNGSCKYGANCRFNHPEPSSIGGPDNLPRYNNGGSVFSPNASQSTHSTWSPPAALNENPHAPLMFSPTQAVPTLSEWNGYQAPLYPVERNMHMPPTSSMNNQLPERSKQMVGDEFPERPGLSECSYYLKTGTCKYKSACKFHHPKSAMPQSPSCHLSESGLPLRPGENVCSYFSRYGLCKYGPACKYDHSINHVHSSDPNVTAVDQAPVVVDSMVNNQALVAGS